MNINAKIAIDNAFSAAGKLLPERAPVEKVMPQSKGKKAKESKKGKACTMRLAFWFCTWMGFHVCVDEVVQACQNCRLERDWRWVRSNHVLFAVLCTLSLPTNAIYGGAPKKGEPSTEAQAKLDTLSPKERLLRDIQTAFEAADVPISEYTTFDARGLSQLLPPVLVARAARCLLEDMRQRWIRT